MQTPFKNLAQSETKGPNIRWPPAACQSSAGFFMGSNFKCIERLILQMKTPSPSNCEVRYLRFKSMPVWLPVLQSSLPMMDANSTCWPCFSGEALGLAFVSFTPSPLPPLTWRPGPRVPHPSTDRWANGEQHSTRQPRGSKKQLPIHTLPQTVSQDLGLSFGWICIGLLVTCFWTTAANVLGNYVVNFVFLFRQDWEREPLLVSVWKKYWGVRSQLLNSLHWINFKMRTLFPLFNSRKRLPHSAQ